jgi:hypothetical protein
MCLTAELISLDLVSVVGVASRTIPVGLRYAGFQTTRRSEKCFQKPSSS